MQIGVRETALDTVMDATAALVSQLHTINRGGGLAEVVGCTERALVSPRTSARMLESGKKRNATKRCASGGSRRSAH